MNEVHFQNKQRAKRRRKRYEHSSQYGRTGDGTLHLEDFEFRFNDPCPVEMRVHKTAASIPILLAERSSMFFTPAATINWQMKILTTRATNKREWRPFAWKRLSFTNLKTPHTEAVLALDRYGTYLFGHGFAGNIQEKNGITEDESDSCSVVLRYYRVNTHGCMHKPSPLLYTVELSGEVHPNNFLLPPIISAWTSNDNQIGVVQTAPEGFAVIPLLRCIGTQAPTSVVGIKLDEPLIHNVQFTPRIKQGKLVGQFYLPGYLISNYDGTFVWVRLSGWNVSDRSSVSEHRESLLPYSVGCNDDRWHVCETSLLPDRGPETGSCPKDNRLFVVSSTRINFCDLLNDLKVRYKGFRNFCKGEYRARCDILNIQDGGRLFEVFLTYSSLGRHLGLVLLWDWETNTYKDVEWFKSSASVENAAKPYESLITKLRMKHERFGPYSVSPDIKCRLLHTNGPTRTVDQLDNRNPIVWEQVAKSTKNERCITVDGPSLLDFDFFNNYFVRRGRPIDQLSCMAGPVEIVYE